MSNATLTPARRDADVKRLDDLIAALRHAQTDPDDLVMEHLHSARTYLLGAMPEEYDLSLRIARQSLDLVAEKPLRDRIDRTLSDLLAEIERSQVLPETRCHPRGPATEHDSAPQPAAGAETALFSFFKRSKTSLGVFYPWRYIIAAFPSVEPAKAAATALGKAGYDADEVRAIPGAEMLKFLDELHAENGVFAAVMAGFSHLIATEAAFVEADIRRAREGAGFVAVCAPKESETRYLRDLLMPFQPVSMHWYRTGGIQSLI